MSAEQETTATTDASRRLDEICLLHCELEAVADALQGTLDTICGDSRLRSQAYGLSLVLQRTVRELGKHAGAI